MEVRGTRGEVGRTLGVIWGNLKVVLGTRKEVRDGSDDSRGSSGLVWGPLGRSGKGRETLREVRDTHGEVRDR